VNESLRSHGMTIALSCVLHAGLVAGLVLGQQWITVAIARPPVLPVQLVTLDAPAEPRPEPPAPPAPRPRERVKPPRLIEASRPKDPPSPAKAEPAPPPPLPIAATAAPISPAPVDSTPALVPSDTGALTGLPTTTIVPSVPALGPPTTASPPVSAAARPSTVAPEGLAQYARPQGGYQVRPSYPAAPRRLGIQGTTMLRVQVLADGRIGDVRVQESAGHPELDDAAVDAVRRWRFEPARRGAEAIAMWVLLPVEFKLR
jgi:protein TonB